MQNLSETFGHSDKKILFCFVFQKKLFTFALAFIIHRLMKVIWLDSLAQLVEHNTFNVGVMGSSPMRLTNCRLALYVIQSSDGLSVTTGRLFLFYKRFPSSRGYNASMGILLLCAIFLTFAPSSY